MKKMSEQIINKMSKFKKLSAVMVIRGEGENDKFIEFIVFLSHFSPDIAEHIRAFLKEDGFAKISDFSRGKDIIVYIDINDEQKTAEYLTRLYSFLSKCLMSKIFIE